MNRMSIVFGDHVLLVIKAILCVDDDDEIETTEQIFDRMPVRSKRRGRVNTTLTVSFQKSKLS